MFEMKYYRKLIQIKWQKKIANKTIICHLKCERSVVKIIKSNKLQLTDKCITRLRALYMAQWKATEKMNITQEMDWQHHWLDWLQLCGGTKRDISGKLERSRSWPQCSTNHSMKRDRDKSRKFLSIVERFYVWIVCRVCWRVVCVLYRESGQCCH